MPSSNKSVDTNVLSDEKSNTAASSPIPFVVVFSVHSTAFVRCAIRPNSPNWSILVCSLLSNILKSQFGRNFQHPFDRSPCPRNYRSEEHTSELQSLMRISYA